jgi:hypothetical protein
MGPLLIGRPSKYQQITVQNSSTAFGDNLTHPPRGIKCHTYSTHSSTIPLRRATALESRLNPYPFEFPTRQNRADPHKQWAITNAQNKVQ